MGDAFIVIATADHFALLGDLDASADRLWRLGQNGAIGWPAATSQCAATAMKERQRHPILITDARQFALRLEEHPVGAQVAAIFVGIAVADHDLLLVATLRQVALVGRILEERPHDLTGSQEILNGFKERGNINFAKERSVTSKEQDLQHIADLGGHTDDIGLNRLIAYFFARPADQAEEIDGGVCLWREIQTGCQGALADNFLFQERHAIRLGHAFVIGTELIPLQHFAHGCAMALGMLAHVQGRQVKAKDLGAADKLLQATTRQSFALVGTKTVTNQVQVVEEFLHRFVGAWIARRRRCPIAPGDLVFGPCGA